MHMQVVMSDTDLEQMVASCPALRQLVLANLMAPIGSLFRPLTQLHALTLENVPHKPFMASPLASLHYLHRLSRLEISSKSCGSFLGDILQHVQRLSALTSLSLTATSALRQDPAFRNLSKLSRLSALERLTHLMLDCRPAEIQILDGPGVTCFSQYLPRLLQLELSCFRLDSGAPEALAMLQHLTQLSVWDMQSLGPMDGGPPCSWKELTLCGERHWPVDLMDLPLRSLERIRMGSGVLHLLLPKEAGPEMAVFIQELRDSAASLGLLSSRLRGAGGRFGAKEVDPDSQALKLKLRPGHVAAAGLFAALVPLRGAIHTLDLKLHYLQGSHVRELGEAFPQLRQLKLRTKELSVGAWACLGAALPGLKTLVLSSDEESFRPEHMAHLASSLAHPLAVAIDGGGGAAALAGLRALLAIPHVGACFIMLMERLPPTAGDRKATWRFVCVPNVTLDWWCAK